MSISVGVSASARGCLKTRGREKKRHLRKPRGEAGVEVEEWDGLGCAGWRGGGG